MDSPVSIDQVTQSLTSSRAPQMDRLKGASDEQIRKTAEDFEGFFVSMMLESMRLFRSPELGDWTSVVDQVATALRSRVSQDDDGNLSLRY